MNTFWNRATEFASVALEVLVGDARPLKTLTLMTLLIIAMAYSLRGSLTTRQLVIFWAIESTSLLLWTVCVVLLHYAGLA